MYSSIDSFFLSRRDFLKNITRASTFFAFSINTDLLSLSTTNEKDNNFIYSYKTMSVNHFKDLQEDIDKLRRTGKLSRNKVFRSYIDNKKFKILEDFPEAKSVIVMATFTKLMYVNFHLNGKKYEVMLPPGYYDDGISLELLQNIIQKKIIKEAGHRIERATEIHLKLLAVRSGLGKYGKNNLCFIDNMGSFLTLYAFLTDFQFEKDNWHEMGLLDACESCSICIGLCPTKCMTGRNFVIDVGKCITLYNEIKGIFPRWIPRDEHNALVGCMKCQLRCPANEKAVKLAGSLEDVTEDETRKILQKKLDEKLLESLSNKLKSFYPATSKEYFPIFTRNLKVLIR